MKDWENVNKAWSVPMIPVRSITTEEARSGSPNAQAWQREVEEARAQETALSFSKDSRCRPGALIEILQGDVTRTLLIGDINVEGGCCGCCAEVNDTDMVLRVKHLIDEV